MGKVIDLEQTFFSRLRKDIELCQECSLCSKSKRYFGEGNPDADVMFITGLPEIHPKGYLLLFELYLKEAGIPFDKVFATSYIKCLPAEIENEDDIYGKSLFDRVGEEANHDVCVRHLEAQIELVKPKVIVPMGWQATKNLLWHFNLRTTIMGNTPFVYLKDKILSWYKGIPIFPIFSIRNVAGKPNMTLLFKASLKRIKEEFLDK